MTNYSYRINVRLSEEDWETLIAIDQSRPNARAITRTHKPNISEALRAVFAHCRLTWTETK